MDYSTHCSDASLTCSLTERISSSFSEYRGKAWKKNPQKATTFILIQR